MPRAAPSTKTRPAAADPDPWMTLRDIQADLGVPERTLRKWIEDGTGPRMIRLPNRELRVRTSWYEDWIKTRMVTT